VPSYSTKDLTIMTKCPLCRKEIKTLTAKETHTMTRTAKVADDWSEEEKQQRYDQSDRWPSREGKALGYVDERDEHATYEYYCPKCGSLLFTSREAALDFLMSR
jgi:hypothetical protein